MRTLVDKAVGKLPVRGSELQEAVVSVAGKIVVAKSARPEEMRTRVDKAVGKPPVRGSGPRQPVLPAAGKPIATKSVVNNRSTPDEQTVTEKVATLATGKLAAKVTELVDGFASQIGKPGIRPEAISARRIELGEHGSADLTLRRRGRQVDVDLMVPGKISGDRVRSEITRLLQRARLPVGRVEITQTMAAAATSHASQAPRLQEMAAMSDEDAIASIRVFLNAFIRKDNSQVAQQAVLNSRHFGQITVQAKDVDGRPQVELTVTSSKARDWLHTRLTERGIQGQNIRVVTAPVNPQSVQPLAAADLLVDKQALRHTPEAGTAEGAATRNLADSGTAPGRSLPAQITGQLAAILEEVDNSPALAKHRPVIEKELASVAARLTSAQQTDTPTQHAVKLPGVAADVEEWLNARVDKLLKQAAGASASGQKHVDAAELREAVAPGREKGRVAGKHDAVTAMAGDKGVRRNTPTETRQETGGDLPKQQRESGAASVARGAARSGVEEKFVSQESVPTPSTASAPSSGQSSAQMTAGTNNQITFDFVDGKLVARPQIAPGQMAEVIQKISAMTEKQTSFSGQKLEVHMDVTNMGRVSVDAARHLDKINLQIQVDSHDIRRLMENQMRPMLEQLAKEGVDIGKLDVSVRDQRSDNLRQEFGQSGQRSSQSFDQEEQKRSSARYVNDMLEQQLRQINAGDRTVEIWV
jgi:hypothetical protein